MKLPKRVNILGVVYKIKYVSEPLGSTDAGGSRVGYIDYNANVITVCVGGGDPGYVWEIILHEVLHGIVAGLNISVLETSHENIDRLSVALADTLRRNRWLK